MLADGAADFQTHIDVSRETLDRLAAYEALIKKWNPAINLVARSTLESIWQRHFLDSADVFQVAGVASGHWLDMGTGGGFPGAVVGILAAELAPDLKVTCIESDIRKCEFLRTVARTTGVQIGILSRRIEETPPQNADVVSARALTSVLKLLEYADRHLAKDGQALFQKGEKWQQEIEEARESWAFALETYPSSTNAASAILKIRDIKRV